MKLKKRTIVGLTGLVVGSAIGSGIFFLKNYFSPESNYASRIEEALQSDPVEQADRLRGVIDAYVCALPSGIVVSEDGEAFYAADALPGRMLIRYGVDSSVPLHRLYTEMAGSPGDAADLSPAFVEVASRALKMDPSLPGTTTQMFYSCEGEQ